MLERAHPEQWLQVLAAVHAVSPCSAAQHVSPRHSPAVPTWHMILRLSRPRLPFAPAVSLYSALSYVLTRCDLVCSGEHRCCLTPAVPLTFQWQLCTRQSHTAHDLLGLMFCPANTTIQVLYIFLVVAKHILPAEQHWALLRRLLRAGVSCTLGKSTGDHSSKLEATVLF